MSFSLGTDESVDSSVEDLFSKLFELAQGKGHQDDKREDKCAIKDSFDLIKRSPVGTTITVQYDVADCSQGDAEMFETRYSDNVVKTKMDCPTKPNPRRRSSRLSIGMGDRRISIDLSQCSTDSRNSELDEILLQLWGAQSVEGDDMDDDDDDESLIEDLKLGVARMDMKRDSLSLVKCRPRRRMSNLRRRSFLEVPEHTELVETKMG